MRTSQGFWEAVLVLGLGLAVFVVLWRLQEPVPQSGPPERLKGV